MCDEFEEGATYKLQKDYSVYVFPFWTKQGRYIWIEGKEKIIRTKNDTGEWEIIPKNTEITVVKNGMRPVFGVEPPISEQASICSYTITVDGTPLTYYFSLTHKSAREISTPVSVISCGIAGGRRKNRSRKSRTSKNRRNRSRRHHRTK